MATSTLSPLGIYSDQKSHINLLLIEDDPDDAFLIQDMLQSVNNLNAHFTVADTLKEGIDQLDSEKIDLVLLDLSLPPESQGIETFRKVLPFAATIPVVVFTGHCDENLQALILREGAQDYLVKGSVNPEILARSIRYAIGRKQADEALRASEQRYKMALESTPDGVWDWNVLTGEVYFSPQWFQSLGYAPGELEPHISSWEKLIHPEDFAKVKEALASHISGEKLLYECEYRLLTKSGQWRWYLDRGRVVTFDANGKPLRMVGIDTDISQLKNTENALKNSQENLQSIYQQLSSIVSATSTAISGEKFFQTLVSKIAVVLDFPFCFISLYVGQNRKKLRTLAFYANGKLVENLEYDTVGTPCEKIEQGEMVFYREKIQDVFPQDQYLKKQGIQSYIGIPLFDERETSLGVFGVMDINPMHHPENFQTILNICAARASAEIQRTAAKMKLEEANNQLERRIQERTRELERTIDLLKKEVGKRERIQGMLEGQNLALKEVAKGSSLADILHTMVAAIEGQLDHVYGSILLLDSQNQSLRVGCQTSLPGSYSQAIDGIALEPAIGPCLLAVSTNETVIVKDLENDPRFPEFKKFALPYGFRACWSTPIHSTTGKVLGTLCLYFDKPRLPTMTETQIIESVVQQAGVAIERKQVEEALKTSEERFRKVFENGPVGMALADLNFSFIKVNNAFCQMLGYSQEEFLRLNCVELTHPEDREKHLQLAKQLIDDQTTHINLEKRFHTNDGRIIWVDQTSTLIRNPEGEPGYFAALFQDISARKQAEESLKTSNDLLDTIMRTQSRYIADERPKQLFDELLKNILRLTKSEFGFIGEIFSDSAGKPYLKTHTLSNISWNGETRKLYELNAETGFEFSNMETLFGAVIKSGQPVISNTPSMDPRSGGLPKGHPPLKSFLGLPFYHGETLIGIVCIANRQGGYEEEFINFLEPFLVTCANLIKGFNNDEQRQRAEKELEHYRNHLESLVEKRTRELTETNQQLQNVVTHRIVIEEELKNSRQMLQLVLDTTPIRIFWKDLDLNFLGCNLNVAKDAGLNSPEEIIGKNDFQFSWRAEAEKYRADDLNVIESGVPKLNFEESQTRPDGSVFWLKTSKVPLRNAHGEVVGILGCYEDITDRKLAEEELKKSQYQLIHAEKLSATGKLIATIAHEINNPIFGIRNVLEKFQNKVSMENKYEKFNDLAIKECNRVIALIKKLQDFHRPSPDKKTPVNINETIDDIIWLIQGQLELKGIHLKKQYESNLPAVFVVEDQVKQVILNLLQNAEESILENNGMIQIKTWSDASTVQLTIQDSGCGIRPDDLGHIFDPFYSTKSEVKGTGLGLSVSYGIVKAHAGNMEVKSVPGMGTTFTVTLPLRNPSK